MFLLFWFLIAELLDLLDVFLLEHFLKSDSVAIVLSFEPESFLHVLKTLLCKVYLLLQTVDSLISHGLEKSIVKKVTLDIIRWFIVHVADAQQVLLQLFSLISYTNEALCAQPRYDLIDSSIRWCTYMDLSSTSTDQHRYDSSNCMGLACTWRAI